MTLGDILQHDSRIFVKSAWGLVSDRWPAFSFSKRAAGNRIQNEYVRNRDFMVYVGTTDPANTQNRDHRGNLLSIMTIDPSQHHLTSDLIPPESWTRADREHRNRWLYSFAITEAWNILELPSARSLIPTTYTQLANPANYGSVVEIGAAERERLVYLPLEAVALRKRPAAIKAEARTRLIDADKSIKQEVYRMAKLITDRINRSGTQMSRWAPMRNANPSTDLQQTILEKLTKQKHRCALCDRPLRIPSSGRLLQSSPDRIDSSDTSYDKHNSQITHLGCNYAKNEFSVNDFEDWMEVITGDIE